MSDEDTSSSADSPSADIAMSKLSGQNDTESTDPNVQALRELLQVEEKKLSVLKTIQGMQGAGNAKVISSIQGSALNKASGRSSGGGASGGRSSPNLRANQPKHSIVVVPGNQASQLKVASSSNSNLLSPRLQQLVDDLPVGHAIKTSKPNSTIVVTGRGITKKLAAVTTPPVPGLTSLSTSKSLIASNDRLFQLSSTGNTPQIKPKIISTNRSSSHEIITISDSSPVGSKNPPPLLSSGSSLRIPTATSNGSIQVPTISSTVVLGQLNANAKSYAQTTAEASRRYREQLIKQNNAKKSFQKQIERRMVVAPYPKTFRQVWPLIPVHDSTFVRNFGLESVMHHFDPNSKALQERSSSKVKPICNQCGCDFASAWQIRKSNSKQLLLCEACDFQNLKILQRSKLSNQLKELRENIKAEVDKFTAEWEERFHDLEKKATENPPPPLTSQLVNAGSGVQRGGNTTTIVGKTVLVSQSGSTTNNRYQVVSSHGKQTAQAHVTTNSMPNQKSTTIVIPSILGQKSESPKQAVSTNEVVAVGSKRRQGGQAPQAPPSKVFKPGSALDHTLNRLSKQLIKRKLDEHRQEIQPELDTDADQAVVVVEGVPAPKPNKEAEKTVTSPTSPSFTTGQKTTKSRRKGTPKHKRHLSASSMTSE